MEAGVSRGEEASADLPPALAGSPHLKDAEERSGREMRGGRSSSSSSGSRTCFLFAGCWSVCSSQRWRRPLLSFLGCHNQSRPLPAAHMLCFSQVRYRGSPHLNCDPFFPWEGGFLGWPPWHCAGSHGPHGSLQGWGMGWERHPLPLPTVSTWATAQPRPQPEEEFPSSCGSSPFRNASREQPAWALAATSPCVCPWNIHNCIALQHPWIGLQGRFFKSPICQPCCSRKAG